MRLRSQNRARTIFFIRNCMRFLARLIRVFRLTYTWVVLWVTVTKSNNYPELIANFYLNCVAGLEGCPVKLRTDCGAENGVMTAMQCTFQQDAEVHKYGSSPVKQRIEGWWVFYRRNSWCKACRKQDLTDDSRTFLQTSSTENREKLFRFALVVTGSSRGSGTWNLSRISLISSNFL